MIVISYTRKNHRAIIHAAANALKAGKIVAYPTDTSYGLACDPTNSKALRKFYNIKSRGNKPVHVVVPSLAYAKKIVVWNRIATKLSKKFLPGPLTIILPLRRNTGYLRQFSAASGFLGIRFSKNQITLDLVKALGRPIPATGANPSGQKAGGVDSYTAKQVYDQFKKQKHKPDIIIDAGTLPRRKPSTLVKIDGNQIHILRKGPISERQIRNQLTSLNVI